MSTEHEEQLVKRVETMEDGRTIIYYTFESHPQDPQGRCGASVNQQEAK